GGKRGKSFEMKQTSILLSISISFYLLAFISMKNNLSIHVIWACSVFVAMFSIGDFMEFFVKEFTEKMENEKSFKITTYFIKMLSYLFFITALPISVGIGLISWKNNVNEDSLSQLINSSTMFVISMLFSTIAIQSMIKDTKE